MQLNPSVVPVPRAFPAMAWPGRGSAGQGGAELGAAGQGMKGAWVPGRRDGSARMRTVWCGQCCAFSTDLEPSVNCFK